jgi:hypothetical protein
VTPPTVVPRSERTVCVTGMHRSGTSFTAHALELLGVSLGQGDRLMRPGPDNPAGYWENRDIKELNDEVLARLGGSWDQPPVLDHGWEHEPSLDRLRAHASDVLDDAFGTTRSRRDFIGWKDPRLSLLLPFWRTVTPITTTIVMVRDPAEVTASLRARNGIETPQAAMLWLRYLFAAAANDPGHLLIDYRDFFVDLPGALAALAAHLGLPPPGQEVTVEAHEHLDPSLRHHVNAAVDPVEDNPLFALAAAVWNGGCIDLNAVPGLAAEAIRWGWLRPPIDGELLARARAEAVELRDRIRRRRRQELAEQSTPASADELHPQSSSAPFDDGSSQLEDVDG